MEDVAKQEHRKGTFRRGELPGRFIGNDGKVNNQGKER